MLYLLHYYLLMPDARAIYAPPPSPTIVLRRPPARPTKCPPKQVQEVLGLSPCPHAAHITPAIPPRRHPQPARRPLMFHLPTPFAFHPLPHTVELPLHANIYIYVAASLFRSFMPRVLFACRHCLHCRRLPARLSSAPAHIHMPIRHLPPRHARYDYGLPPVCYSLLERCYLPLCSPPCHYDVATCHAIEFVILAPDALLILCHVYEPICVTMICQITARAGQRGTGALYARASFRAASAARSWRGAYDMRGSSCLFRRCLRSHDSPHFSEQRDGAERRASCDMRRARSGSAECRCAWRALRRGAEGAAERGHASARGMRWRARGAFSARCCHRCDEVARVTCGLKCQCEQDFTAARFPPRRTKRYSACLAARRGSHHSPFQDIQPVI